MKMPSMSPKSSLPKGLPSAQSSKPYFRARKIRHVAESAFPTAPGAFPATENMPSSGADLDASTNAMPSGAGGGDMGQ